MKISIGLFSLFLILTGCGGKPQEAPDAADHDHAATHADEDAHAEGEPEEAHEDVLELDPEMLRDLKLTTFAAELRPGGEGLIALGELRIDEARYAEVGSPIAARIVRLLVAPGETVARGQVLAQLESVELGRTRAASTTARARAELAQKTVARKRSLAAERIVPEGELQRAEAELATAEAEQAAAEAELAALGAAGEAPAEPSRFLLRAPIAGTVLERRAALGQAADPASTLFRIADLSRLWLLAQAAEHDAVRIRPGDRAMVTLAALPEMSLRGTVDWLGREVDPHSRTVPVRIVLPNDDGALLPGMFASALIVPAGDTAEVVAVPAAALQRLEGRWVVFLPRAPGRFEIRAVERGRDLGGEVALADGLAAGETVVVDGAFLLRAEAERGDGAEAHHHH